MGGTYHKIQSVFKRDGSGRFTPEFSCPEFAYLADNVWDWSEKVDGTNVRVIYDPTSMREVEFRGKTNKSQMPGELFLKLQDLFSVEKLQKVFDGAAILYGEGIGLEIQKGGHRLRKDGPDFVLFDVRVGDWWLKREDVFQVASSLEISAAPFFGGGTLGAAIKFVSGGFASAVAEVRGTAAEGLVLRPRVELLARSGARVITKLKTKDFRK